MKLYHYTSLEHLREILKSKEIKVSPSNLLCPVDPKLINGVLTDITDSYKPTVWLTTIADFGKALQMGLTITKTEALIQIEALPNITVYRWTEWAERNGIDKQWYNDLKATAPLYKTFYVSERPIKITNQTQIVFRPDIKAQLERR